MIDLQEAIKVLDAAVGDAARGLPEDVFRLVTRLTPMINVDLLVKDSQGRTLLTWRDDGLFPAGWHVPGGIIRFKETAAQRVHETAIVELGVDVEFDPEPILRRELIHPVYVTRGHFFSMLYRCRLLGPPDADLQYVSGPPRHGQWCWHVKAPRDLMEVHRFYAPYIEMA